MICELLTISAILNSPGTLVMYSRLMDRPEGPPLVVVVVRDSYVVGMSSPMAGSHSQCTENNTENISTPCYVQICNGKNTNIINTKSYIYI